VRERVKVDIVVNEKEENIATVADEEEENVATVADEEEREVTKQIAVIKYNTFVRRRKERISVKKK
jgi:hypothetical protein